MMNINLLPWRYALKIRQAKRLSLSLFLALMVVLGVLALIEYHARQRLAEEAQRHQQSEQHMAKLMAAYQKKIIQQHKPHPLSGSRKNAEVSEVEDVVLESEVIQVNYAKAPELAILLRDPAGGVLSERGLITADPRTNVIWVQDTHENMLKFKQILRHLDVPSRQVLIEARLVNMSQESAQDLGVRFGMLGDKSDVSNASDAQAPSATSQGHNRLNVDLGAIPLEATATSIGIAVATLSQNTLLDMELSALESEGRAEIIASPRLVATNQEPAVIESGEDIPYQEVTPSGATSVSFKKAVLSLKVLPHITAEGKLMMALSINQNSDSGRRVQGVPIILTKAIETHVLVNHGQTIVLGGIYKQDQHHNVARIPFLGTLPWVGGLFRRQQVRAHHDELLIFITPKIIPVT